MQRMPLLALLACIPLATLGGKAPMIQVGEKPPALDFRIYSGDSTLPGIRWEDLKNRAVIIDFWATWCSPCIKSFPHLNAMVEQFADQPITFLSITYEPPRLITPFLAKHQLESVIGIDDDFAMFKSFGAWGIPMLVAVNREGRIACVIHPKHLTADLINEVLAGEIPDVPQAERWPDPKGAEKYFRSLLKER